MSRTPIRIRSFILGTVLLLLLTPAIAGGAAWLLERDRQQADIQHRLHTALAYLSAHRADKKASLLGFAELLDRLGLLAQVVALGPDTKNLVYISPALNLSAQKQAIARETKAGHTGGSVGPPPAGDASLDDAQRLIPVGTPRSRDTLAVDLYYRPASQTTRALVALITATIVLLSGLGIAVWLAGRWMVAPLAKLSAQVDKVAGGDLTITAPRSRIGEITNIAQAVDGMTTALGEAAHQRAEADEARRFLVTSIAHDLRTPLFALRGHLQAISGGLGNPATHLQRAEARADALERLIGNLFAYTRDDYTQPALKLEAIPVAEVLPEVTASLEHTAHLRNNTFELDGDENVAILVDRDRIKRALTNVLDNALRYSPAGTTIHINWTTAEATSIEINIHDQGPGIDPDLLPHIFEPGIRGNPTPGAPNEGSGLGLTIAKRLLEHQHATITAGNQPSGGAVISLTLQRAPTHRPDPPAQATNRDATLTSEARPKPAPD